MPIESPRTDTRPSISRRRAARALLIGILIMAPLCASSASPQSQTDPDVRTIKQRLIEETLDAETYGEKTLRGYVDSLKADGSWPDVDYHNQERAGGFRAFAHIGRLHKMALALHKQDHALHNDPALRKATVRALDHWLRHDYQHPNWWFQTIGVPRILFRILLLIDDDLNEVQHLQALELLHRGKISMTGQNLVWVADITCARGCIENDPDPIAEAFQAIANEIRITQEEGIQPDYSFYQHGPCLYSGGYGQGFAGDCARYALLGRGTRFALPPEKIDILERYILDGSQWMMRAKFFDYGAKGREITRKGTSGAGMPRAARKMAALDTPRRAEFEAMARRTAAATAPADNFIQGNRCFWRSDFMVHHRQGYFASARMHSKGVANTDAPCNEEGLLSHHLADGCTYFFRRGNEYDRIFGAWDWTRIPGCTIEQKPLRGNPRRMGTTDFAGGASDGQYGLAGFDFERAPLTARKAWFFFEREIVCLGAGISCKSPNPVLTSINQCHLVGPVAARRADPKAQDLDTGTHEGSDFRWVYHDGIGYVPLAPCRLTVKNEDQPTDWRRINHGYKKAGKPTPVFSAWIDHGANPTNASYAYAVAPDILRDDMADYASALPFRVVANTPDLQAVVHADLAIAGAVFYAPGAIDLPGFGALSVDQPGALLLRRLEDGLRIAIADPTGRKRTYVVQTDQALRGKAASAKDSGTEIRMVVPGDAMGGSSVVREYKNR